MNGPSIREIKALAQDRLELVLRELGVHERPRAGGYISMCNPMRKDGTPSLTIWTRPSAPGAWKDHANEQVERGDVIDLVAYLKGWWHEPERERRHKSLDWLAELLGLKQLSQAGRARLAANVAARRERAITADQGEEERRRQAFAMWLKAQPILGTRADTYLRSRGIDIEQLPAGPRGGSRIPKVLRYFEKHMHLESRRELPCMIAAMVDIASGKVAAVHRTWLAIDGKGKSDVRPARKIWPGFAGLVIPLWRGESWLSVKEAAAQGLRETLVLTEGIEDGLSYVLADPRPRVWAAGSLANIGNVVLPECIDSVVVHRQNDWHSRQALEAFDRVRERLEAQGRPVAELAAFAGKDINDVLRGGTG